MGQGDSHQRESRGALSLNDVGSSTIYVSEGCNCLYESGLRIDPCPLQLTRETTLTSFRKLTRKKCC